VVLNFKETAEASRGTFVFQQTKQPPSPESAEKVAPTVAEGSSRESAELSQSRQNTALYGIFVGSLQRSALYGKRRQITAPTPLPATTFRQQTRVVEHKGGMRLGVFWLICDCWSWTSCGMRLDKNASHLGCAFSLSNSDVPECLRGSLRGRKDSCAAAGDSIP
jgi:hypothetical protein